MVDGLFCGIELEEPVGQHDGKVDGRRYFRAGYNRGIFAPMEKVELIDKEPLDDAFLTRHQLTTATPNLIIPADAEYLTDVEPHLMCHSLLGQSMTAGNESFELSESLTFLKGSRFPGMDVSMTPDQLAAQFGGVDDDGVAERRDSEERSNEANSHSDDLEADYALAKPPRAVEAESDECRDDDPTPVLEQHPEQIDFDTANDFKTSLVSSTPMASAQCADRKTANMDETVTLDSSRSVCKPSDTSQAQAMLATKERPISTISADTGYQGDTEYETQSGRSVSPREMDVMFERKQQQPRTSDPVTVDLVREKSEMRHESPPQHAGSGCGSGAGSVSGSVECLSCETTIRDSRGRVVKVVKELKRIPKDRLSDISSTSALQSLVQNSHKGVQSPSTTTPSSPSKTKRAKSESIGRESQRKPAKNPKVIDGPNKENSSQRDGGSRPSSGIGGSPTRRRTEKMEEPVKKIVKTPAKPSKHSEIMAKLQQSMAQEKQKPKKEIKSKFMSGIPATAPVRSDGGELTSLPPAPARRLSLLPTARSRASSTASSVHGGNQNEIRSTSPSTGNGGGGVSTHQADEKGRFVRLQTIPSKITTPSEDKRSPVGEQASTDSSKVTHSSPGKDNAAVKKTTTTASGQAKAVGVARKTVADTQMNKFALVKKTATGTSHTKDTPGRPSSAAGAQANGVAATSNGTITSASGRNQAAKRKSPPPVNKEASKRLHELDAKAEQLKVAKERLRHNAMGFEALSVIIRYYVEQVVPGFRVKLDKMKTELESARHHTDDLTKSNDSLQIEKRQQNEVHSKAMEELCREYEHKVKKLETDLRASYEQKKNELASEYNRDLANLRQESEREQMHHADEYKRQLKAEMERFEEKVTTLQEQHGRDVADLKYLHQNTTDDLLRRFEEEKSVLSLKIDELQTFCDKYKREARRLEEALMKDTEKKMSTVSERFTNYQREIDSLQAVMQMKNQEMHDLRAKCSLLEKDLEELPKCRTKIALLEQKNAELKESLDLKKQAEKLFYQQHSELLQSCERERERCQRLSMDNEQLEFKLKKVIMSQSAYETPLNRLSGDEMETDSTPHCSKRTSRVGSGASGTSSSALKDKPMSQSLIQIYAESSPWSPRTNSRTGHQHDSKDLPVTVYMAAQEGGVAKVLHFDTDGECSPPGKVRDATARSSDHGKPSVHSSSDSLTSPQTLPRSARSVDKVSSPKRRISPLRRRNVSLTGNVAPMPATPEHPADFINGGERLSSEPPPDCPKSKEEHKGFACYDGHDPQDPAPPLTEAESANTCGKLGCTSMSSAVGWTDSGVFTTSCISDTQETITGNEIAEHDSMTQTVVATTATSRKVDNRTTTADGVTPVQSTASVGSGPKLPKKNGAI